MSGSVGNLTLEDHLMPRNLIEFEGPCIFWGAIASFVSVNDV